MTSGNGISIDFIATDILKSSYGRIANNWHLENNLTILRRSDSVSDP